MTSSMRTFEVDWDMTAITGLMFYEGVKWGLFEIYYQYTPGASTRRMRQLRRLREATSLAIERELERASATGLYQSTPSEATAFRQQPSSVSSSESMRRRQREATSPHHHEQPSSMSPRREETPPRPSPVPDTPPRRTFTTTPPMSPDAMDGWNSLVSGETKRVCYDTIMLMRLEEIREGLRLTD